MGRIVILFYLIFGVQVYTIGQSFAVKGKSYRGFVFDSSVFIFKSIDGQKNRYNLTNADVEKVENILCEKLTEINRKRVNQVASGCPVIHKRLKKYYRQYVGFLNQEGDIVVWVNLFWDKELIERATEEIIEVNDGCSYYWNIEVNITTSELKNLIVNGSG